MGDLIIGCLGLLIITIVAASQSENGNNTTLINDTINGNTIINNDHPVFHVNFTNFTIFVVNNDSDGKDPLNIPTPETLYSQKYEEAAAYFSNTIDYAANPCEDFYQYACGNYTGDHYFTTFEKIVTQKLIEGLSKDNDKDVSFFIR